MATGKRYYWLKLRETFLTSDAVDFLMSQENGANYVVLYQMICLKTINTDGHLARQIGEIIIPYDEAKISRDCKWFSIDTVRVALNLYKALGLVYEDADGVLVLTNHKEMVGSETDYAQQKKNQRLAKKAVSELPPPEENSTDVDNVHTDVHADVRGHVHTDIRDKILDNIISSSNEEDCPKPDGLDERNGGKKKRKKPEPLPKDHNAYKAATWLSKKIKKRMPERKELTEDDIQRWARDIDKLHRIDGYEWELISDILIFSQKDKFWQTNILSGDAFRRNFDKLMAQEGRADDDS